MTQPYYTDDTVQVIHGDCLKAMRAMEPNTVDAVVTDPPAAIAFMNKTWDHNRGGRTQWVTWLTDVMAETHRVLKPGGHALVWALPRTSHWTAWAIEDAGYDLRDCVVHIQGAGFPKSLDVGKAIDKRPGVTQHAEFAADLRAAMKTKGYTDTFDVAEAVTGRRTGAVANWQKYQFPQAKWWPALRDLLDMDEAKWGPVIAEAEREVVGARDVPLGHAFAGGTYGGDSSNQTVNITAPATDDARQWEGWGTALKPAAEMWWLAQKPAGQTAILSELSSHLQRLETECTSTVSDAASHSAPTPHVEPEAKTDTAPGSAATQRGDDQEQRTATGPADASSAVTGTLACESTASTASNTVSSWKQCWAALSDEMNTSTTGTTSSTTTDLKTLSSCLAQITAAHIQASRNQTSGPSSLVSAVDNLFAACLLRSRATLAFSATASATYATPNSQHGVTASAEPASEHWWLARKPLSEPTVAANVLKWGTGALNIDASRVGAEPRWNPAAGNKPGGASLNMSVTGMPTVEGSQTSGRWPANLVLSHAQSPDGGDACEDGCVPGCPVAELDAQSGQGKSTPYRWADHHNKSRDSLNAANDGSLINPADHGYTDTGGASRLFHTFRYQAKAPKTERPRAKVPPQPVLRMRDDLTDEQRNYVLTELTRAGVNVA